MATQSEKKGAESMNKWFEATFEMMFSSQEKVKETFFDEEMNKLYGENEPKSSPNTLEFVLKEYPAENIASEKVREAVEKKIREKAFLLIKRAKEIDPKMSYKPADIKDLIIITTEGPINDI